jgi:enamine deaminase RidA (YjgF/YER057c/UK114 family)
VEIQNGARILQCAGRDSIDEAGRVLHKGGMRAQAGQATNNVETVLGAAGLSLKDITRSASFSRHAGTVNREVIATSSKATSTVAIQ